MAEGWDVVVVGAGIVGTACAAELAAGGLRVAVVERELVGGGATAAGMGHIVVLDEGEAQLALTRCSQLLWAELVAADPRAHQALACGTIWVAADAEELAAAHEKRATYAAHGIPCTLLDRAALYGREPHLRPGLAGGLLVPDDSVVYPPSSAALLLDRARGRGAALRQAAVRQLLPGAVALADGGELRAEAIVLAGGMRSLDLAPELPLRAKKGHLAITDRYPGFVRHQLVELGYIKSAHAADGDSVAFNLQPRATDQLLIGSSRQFDDERAAVDYPVLSAMLARAIAYMPGLAGLSMTRVWTGVRAATPDGLPLIGPHPGRPGLWLATGHEGLGITTALATAHLLAAQLLRRAPLIPSAPYLPARLLGEVARG